MLMIPGFPSGRSADPAVEAPMLVRGPRGPWQRMRDSLARRGAVVVYGRPADWAVHAAALGDDRLRALLGRDWDRYRRMGHPRIRERFTTSRLLLKHAAAAALDTRPDLLELAYQAGGRPYLRGCDQIDVSLSHTDDLMAVGLTRLGLIGVDTETADRAMIGTGVESQACTPHERDLLAALPADRRNAALVRLWTLKEAYSKAIGQGLRFRFTEFGFTLGSSRVQVARPDGAPGTGEEWTFGTSLVDRRFVVSVALYDAGFGDLADTAVETTLDEGMLDALLGPPH